MAIYTAKGNSVAHDVRWLGTSPVGQRCAALDRVWPTVEYLDYKEEAKYHPQDRWDHPQDRWDHPQGQL